MDLGLDGRVVLISGAHRGTGAGTAKVFAGEGARVAVHGFDEGAADEVVADIRSAGGVAEPVHGSLSDRAGAASVVAQTQAALGEVEVLVNNYGAPVNTKWSDAEADWHDAWDVNVVTGIRLVHEVLPAMRANRAGRILFLGTVGTAMPGDRNADYYGAKAGLLAIVRSLAQDVRGTGITANVVSPGLIATAEVRAMLLERSGADTWEEAQAWGLDNTIPNLTGRVATPEDIGRVVAFVASDAGWHINGTEVRVDGGAVDAR